MTVVERKQGGSENFQQKFVHSIPGEMLLIEESFDLTRHVPPRKEKHSATVNSYYGTTINLHRDGILNIFIFSWRFNQREAATTSQISFPPTRSTGASTLMNPEIWRGRWEILNVTNCDASTKFSSQKLSTSTQKTWNENTTGVRERKWKRDGW